MIETRVNKRKQKKALKIIQNNTVRKLMSGEITAEPISPKLITASYYGARLILAFGIIATIISACRVSRTNSYWFEYIMPVLWLFGSMGIGLMISAIYKGAAMGVSIKNNDLPFNADNEMFSYDGSHYVYSYKNDLLMDGTNTSRFTFNKNDIERIDYDETTKLLTVYGNITEERYRGDMLIQSYPWAKLSFLNTFEGADVYKILIESS